MNNVSQIVGVDLFCGAGGLTCGLKKAGVQIGAGVDVDPDCKYPYETNNGAKFIEADVNSLSSDALRNCFPRGVIKLLAGCAPCQPFSTYSRKVRAGGKEDDKWALVKEFGRLVREVEPELVTMENVPQLLDHSVFADLCSSLSGYQIWYRVIDCAHYGVPQTRKRLVMLASRFGPIELISPTHVGKFRTVRDAIGGMQPLAAGECDKRDPVHRASALSETNLKRIRKSKPGGTWRDWEVGLRAKCHVKFSGVTYPSVYGRMEWDKPAPTITTQCFGFGNGRFGHPTQHRAISLREAAILQTFPARYRFAPSTDSVRFSTLGRLIGNAVPVRIGEIVGRSLVHHVRNL